MFSRLHPAKEVQRYCQVKDAQAQWATFQQDLDKTVNKIHQMEQLLMSGMETESSETVRGELWSLYKWTFNAFKIKGIVEQQIASNESHGRSLTVSGTT
jgi:hypothetical protein